MFKRDVRNTCIFIDATFTTTLFIKIKYKFAQYSINSTMCWYIFQISTTSIYDYYSDWGTAIHMLAKCGDRLYRKFNILSNRNLTY